MENGSIEMKFENKHLRLLDEAKPSWLYPTYIPSTERAGRSTILDLVNKSPAAIRRKVTAVVSVDEKDEYLRHYPKVSFHFHDRGKGIGLIRSLIFQLADGIHDRIMMIDDDIYKVSMLQRIEREGKPDHSRRFNYEMSGYSEPQFTVRSLAASCRIADAIFEEDEYMSYGGVRNALFSGSVDTDFIAHAYKGSFPAQVMLFDMNRIQGGFPYHEEFRYHGEDLLYGVLSILKGSGFFTIQGIAFDEKDLDSTVPLNTKDSVARRIDIQNIIKLYPDAEPYLREAYRNKQGGVLRVGFRWRNIYEDFDNEIGPMEIRTNTIMERIGL